MGNDSLLCICQACDCQNHRCEHEAIDQPLLKSVHDDSELECFETIYTVERTLPIIPEDNLCIPDEPMEGISRYKSEFISHTLDNVHVTPPKRTYQRPLIPMENETEYRRIYHIKPIERPQKYFKKDQPLQTDVFEGKTTYNSSFPTYDVNEMNYSRGKAVFKRGSSWGGIQEFKDRTNYADTFTAHPGARVRHPLKPARQSLAGLPIGAKFYDCTTHKEQFTKKIGKRRKLIKQRSNTDIFKSPLEMSFPISSMKRDYVNYYNVKRICPFVPDRQAVHTDIPFEKDTTYKHEYWHRQREPPYPQPEWSKRKPYKIPSKEFSKDSTYRQEFKVPHLTEPAVPLKPKTSPLQFGKDDIAIKDTTYKTQFKQPPAGDYKGVSFAPKKIHDAPVHPVRDVTTMQDHFRGLQYPHTEEQQQIQPVELQTRYKDKKMSARTEYKERYGVTYRHVPPKTAPSRDVADKDRRANPIRCLHDPEQDKTTTSTASMSNIGSKDEITTVNSEEKSSSVACADK